MPVRVSAYLYDVPGEASQVHLGGLGGGAAAAPLAVAVSVVLLHRLGSEEDNETQTTLFIQEGFYPSVPGVRRKTQ